MPKKAKKQKLRAFKVSNNHIDQPHSGLLDVFKKILKESKANDRRMALNQDDIRTEEDLLADYNIAKLHASGVMLRMASKGDSPIITGSFLQNEKISVTELNKAEDDDSFSYINHYYFVLDNKFIVSNLQSNFKIKRFQVYLNYLLSEGRGSSLFEFTPIVTSELKTKLSDLKKIIVRDDSVSTDDGSQDTSTINNRRLSIKSLNILKELMNDVDSLEQIAKNNIISAELFIKFTKPRKMPDSEYQRVMGAYMKAIDEADDVVFETKKYGRIKGSEVLLTKEVEIEMTESGMIVEQELFQEMELFLNHLRHEYSD